MTEVLREYLPAILIAVVIGLIVGFLIFRPRQRVRLTESTPLRPHMTNSLDSSKEGNSLADEAAAATGDVTGEIISAPVHQNLGDGGLDDFQRMKGVGPKFAQTLNARGFNRFEQLARLSPEEIERLDPELGAFRGRIQRDRIIEQADYLARGDQDGFENRFGKL